jgi:hypothetical protein
MQTQEKQSRVEGLSWVEGLSQAEGEECLANLHRLAGQLDSAMDAIVRRRLSSLNDSLHLQQISCGRLADLRFRSEKRQSQPSGPESGFVGPDLAVEIEAATESVLVLNSRYSALLKHSGDTLQMLAGLYRSYRGFAQSSSGMQASVPTWSCEV